MYKCDKCGESYNSYKSFAADARCRRKVPKEPHYTGYGHGCAYRSSRYSGCEMREAVGADGRVTCGCDARHQFAIANETEECFGRIVPDTAGATMAVTLFGGRAR